MMACSGSWDTMFSIRGPDFSMHKSALVLGTKSGKPFIRDKTKSHIALEGLCHGGPVQFV